MTDSLRLLQDDQTVITFVPRRLSVRDGWLFVLRRLYPRSSDPIRRAILQTFLGTVYFALAGFVVGAIARDRLDPGLTTFVGLALGALFPIRFLRVRRLLLGQLGWDESYTIGIHPAGLTVATATRHLLIAWPAVVGVRVTRREVVVDLRSPDVVSAPMSVFRHDRHLLEFVQVVDRHIAQARLGLAS